MDFSESFDTVSRKILAEILSMYGLDEQTENWLNGRAQREVISATMAAWRPRTSSVLQGSVLGPVVSSHWQVTPNCHPDWEQWLICQRILLPATGTFTGLQDKWADRNFKKFKKFSSAPGENNPRHQ